MPAFLARSTMSLFKRSVTFLLDIGRMTYVQKVFGDFGFGKGRVGGEDGLVTTFVSYIRTKNLYYYNPF